MKLSIIVTCYNIAPYLEKCLDSICNQTLKDLEIIIIDDASTDGTQDIINAYKAKDARVKTLFFKENTIGGVSSAANAGIDIAEGDYIGFADGDDWYELDMFEKLYNAATKSNHDVAFCNYLEFDEANSELKNPSDAKKWNTLDNFSPDGVSNEQFRQAFLRLNPVPWRKIYKKELLGDSIRYPVGDYFFEDNPFHWETTLKAKSFAFIDYVGCYHRINRPGQTMSTANFKLIAMYEHHTTIYEMLIESGAYDKFKQQNIGWLIGNTEWITKKIGVQYLKDNFKAFRAALLKHGEKEVTVALSHLPTGMRGRQLVKFALNNNYRGFRLTAIEKNLSLIDQAYLSYSEDGIKPTLKRVCLYIGYRFPLSKLFFLRKNNTGSLHGKSIDKVAVETLKEVRELKKSMSSIQGELRAIKMALLLDKVDK